MYLNGKKVILPDTVLQAVGESVIPPIFNNVMDISEETVNCTPPSRFLDNELSCNILNNYGKELQFIALVACIVAVIALINILSKKHLKPTSSLKKLISSIHLAFGPAYLIILWEGANLEVFGLTFLHIRLAAASSCQLIVTSVAILLLGFNIAMMLASYRFLKALVKKLPTVA